MSVCVCARAKTQNSACGKNSLFFGGSSKEVLLTTSEKEIEWS